MQFLHYHPLSSRDEIARGTAFDGSDATMKRQLAAAVAQGDVVVEGKARASRTIRMPDCSTAFISCSLEFVSVIR